MPIESVTVKTSAAKVKSRQRDSRSQRNGVAAKRSKSETSPIEIASMEFARKVNRDAVLKLIRLMQPIARVDLARASGLQNSTVSSLVEQLLAEGWIREGEILRTARGRRPTQISLNDRLSMLVADVHPGRAQFGVVDLNGQVLSCSEFTMPLDVEEGVQKLGFAMQQMRAIYADRQFEGAGVCIPGRVDLRSEEHTS